MEAVRLGYGWNTVDVGTGKIDDFFLKYKDDEGDLCTLAETTVEDFLSLAAASSGRPLRVFIIASAQGQGQQMPENNSSVNPTSGLQASAPPFTPLSLQTEVLSADGALLWEVALDEMCKSKGKAKGWNKGWGRGPYWCRGKGWKGCGKGFADSFAANEACWTGVGSNGLCHGAGPMRLLACVRGLHNSGRLTPKALASLALQFLPILAQRAHRKQEKFNRMACKPWMRELLLPLLQGIVNQLDQIPEAVSLKPALQAYISGSDTTHFGDLLAQLLRILASSDSQNAIASVLLTVAEELLALLPQLFPNAFGDTGAPYTEVGVMHAGFTCNDCGECPISGPRFEYTGDNMGVADGCNLCSECFIHHNTVHLEHKSFTCHFAPNSPIWQ